jgi:hypothetical protein
MAGKSPLKASTEQKLGRDRGEADRALEALAASRGQCC